MDALAKRPRRSAYLDLSKLVNSGRVWPKAKICRLQHTRCSSQHAPSTLEVINSITSFCAQGKGPNHAAARGEYSKERPLLGAGSTVALTTRSLSSTIKDGLTLLQQMVQPLEDWGTLGDDATGL